METQTPFCKRALEEFIGKVKAGLPVRFDVPSTGKVLSEWVGLRLQDIANRSGAPQSPPRPTVIREERPGWLGDYFGDKIDFTIVKRHGGGPIAMSLSTSHINGEHAMLSIASFQSLLWVEFYQHIMRSLEEEWPTTRLLPSRAALAQEDELLGVLSDLVYAEDGGARLEDDLWSGYIVTSLTQEPMAGEEQPNMMSSEKGEAQGHRGEQTTINLGGRPTGTSSHVADSIEKIRHYNSQGLTDARIALNWELREGTSANYVGKPEYLQLQRHQRQRKRWM